ncbi:deaminase domain-containing protein, partial [Carnobacterium gallinarum]
CSGKDWYKKISDYNTASPTQRIEIVQTDEYGYGLKVYIDGHYSKQASDNLMYAQSQDYLKEMGRTAVTMTGELTGAYDVYRLFTGKDPLTGDKTGRLEAGLWTAILLLPQAKMVMAAKELKAGNKALKGLNLTEKELNLLNKSGYFEDVGKLEKASGLTKAQKVEKFQDRINDVRNKMPNNTLKKRGNMATADVNVTGLPDTFMAHSQIDSLTDKGADLGDFSMKNSESERFFKNYEPSASTINGRKYDRFHDTEAKILEDIASKITDPNTFGTIDLFTELPACQSCSNIILEFRSKFPNIQLNIFTKN